MAEKVTDKVKRLARELADSVRAELDLKESPVKTYEENLELKKHIHCYLSEKESVSSVDESISFLRGFYEAKTLKNGQQMKFKFAQKE